MDSVLDTEAYDVAPGGECLLEPRRAIVANFPIRRDSGEMQSLTGYRVQLTFALGPTKGGVRYARVTEAARLRSIYP